MASQYLPAEARNLDALSYEAIRRGILTGQFAPGDVLSEAALARSFGVSKTPVREALIRLRGEGLVEVYPHRGARVVDFSPDDVDHLCELRLLLELPLVETLARARPADVLAALRDSIEEGREALDAGDRERYLDAVWRFSSLLQRTSPNPRIVQVLESIQDQLRLIGASELRARGRDRRSLDEHEAILTAIEQGDVPAALDAARRHVASIVADVPR